MVWTIIGAILCIWIFGCLAAVGLSLLLSIVNGVRKVFRAPAGTTETANREAQDTARRKKAEYDRQEQELKASEDQAPRATQESFQDQQHRIQLEQFRIEMEEALRGEGSYFDEQTHKQTEQFWAEVEENSRKEDERCKIRSDNEYYRSILGLEGQVTPAKVKQLYRQLVTEFHPDKNQHLNLDHESKDFCEEQMKLANAAYEYFRKRYKF